MALSNDLISQFVKVTKDKQEEKKDTIVYGTVQEVDGSTFVKIDGSEILTPISSEYSATVAKNNDRVTILVKNHAAIITGNLSSPSATNKSVTDLGTVVADKVSSSELETERARIDTLVTDNITVKNKLNAAEASIDDIEADNITINQKLTAAEGDINNLKTNKLDASVADIKYATIENLNSTNGRVYNLETTYTTVTGKLTAAEGEIDDLKTNKLDINTANATFANIDFSNISKATMGEFYAKSGLIENVVIGDTTISGTLVGVTISGDLIVGNTIKADKFVIKGSDGLYYKLNTDGVTVEEQQTDQNSINGSVIKAKSITASKITVNDLVAFGATIGGFTITDNSLSAYAKDSEGNNVRGIYMDNDGQLIVGDAHNYFKYYKDDNGSYKLDISAVDNLSIGGRNLLSGTKDFSGVSLNSNVTFDSDYLDLKVVKLSYLETSGYLDVCQWNNYIDVEPSKYYTLSFYAKGNGNIESYFYGTTGNGNPIETVMHSNGYTTSNPDGRSSTSLTENWTKYWITYKTKSDASGMKNVLPARVLPGSTVYLCGVKFEVGNKATDWTPAPEDVDNDIFDASKTATNYMKFDGNGLSVGDMNGASLGKHVNINSESVDVRNDSKVLARFASDRLELGKDNPEAEIDFCNGAAKIHSLDTTGAFDRMDLSSDQIQLSARNLKVVAPGVTDESGNTFAASMNLATSRPWEGLPVYPYAITDVTYNQKSTKYLYISKSEVGPDTLTNSVSVGGTEPGASVNFSRESHLKVTTGYAELMSYDRLGSDNYREYMRILLDGNKISLSAGDIQFNIRNHGGEAYYPYYKPGDSLSIGWAGAGYITNSMKSINFTISLPKPIIGNTTVTISSVNGLTLRQENKYTHGSTATVAAKPDSYTATKVICGVRVTANFTNTTNAINNSAIGVYASILITFS